MSFVDAHDFSVDLVLRVLGIPASTYYDWRARRTAPSLRQREDEELLRLIDAIRGEHEFAATYGSPRVWLELRRRGVRVGRWTSPGFPETYLSGIGALWLEGSRLRVVLLPGVPDSLVFVGREPAEALLDAAGVVPSVDVAEQRRLRLCSCGESGCGPVDQLNLDG